MLGRLAISRGHLPLPHLVLPLPKCTRSHAGTLSSHTLLCAHSRYWSLYTPRPCVQLVSVSSMVIQPVSTRFVLSYNPFRLVTTPQPVARMDCTPHEMVSHGRERGGPPTPIDRLPLRERHGPHQGRAEVTRTHYSPNLPTCRTFPTCPHMSYTPHLPHLSHTPSCAFVTPVRHTRPTFPFQGLRSSPLPALGSGR